MNSNDTNSAIRTVKDFTPRVGCEKYRTSEMKKEEVETFMEAALRENGDDMSEAWQDMRMIDAMLYAKRLHAAVGHEVRKTRAGYYRKGSDIYTMMDGIVQARVDGKFNF